MTYTKLLLASVSLMIASSAQADTKCSKLIDSLTSCTPYACQMEHGIPPKLYKHRVIGLKDDGTCEYTQSSKIDGIFVELTLVCQFPEDLRVDFADTLRVATGQFGPDDDFSAQEKRVNDALKQSEICTIRQ